MRPDAIAKTRIELGVLDLENWGVWISWIYESYGGPT